MEWVFRDRLVGGLFTGSAGFAVAFPAAVSHPTTNPSPAWPQAASMEPDKDYEQIGPQVFRLEYYYVLKGQDVSGTPSILSDTPWDTRAPLSHTSLNGLSDVAAIGVVIAVIDSKTRAIVTDEQLKSLAVRWPILATR